MDAHGDSMSSWDYLDFELEIRGEGPREYPVAVRSPAGEAQAQMRFPYDEWELKDRLQSLEIALLRSGGTRRRIPSPEEHTVQDFGRGLFESLLVGDVRTRYEMSLSEARRQGKGLRLKLRIQPSELAVLPWEFLYDAERDRYPSLSSNTPLVRYLDLPQPVEPLRVSPPLRVLGFVTSPLGLDPLDVEHEKRLVEVATKGLRERGLLELTWLEGQTWRHLQRAMRRGPWHIFHFVGHGGFDPATEEGAIALSDDAGRMHLLRAYSLAELLDDHYPLRLVFLNSCEGARGSENDAFSSTAATLVRRGVPAVVAMQYEITDRAAIEFSRDFYEALADSLPVDAAVTEARAAVSMDSMLEWGTPVLYMHSPDGRVFDILVPTPPAHPTRESEGQQEQDPLRQYREHVESAWADGKLEVIDVQRLRDLANDELRLSSGTAADIEREVMGDTIEAILKRQEEAAKQEVRNRRLEELYAQARRLHRDRKWQAVIDVFEQIHDEDPAYSDPEGLLRSARQSLEASEAQRHQTAGRSTEQAERMQPDYSTDTQSQLLFSILGKNWWALALAGLIDASHGLGDYLVIQSDLSTSYRLLAGSMIIAIGVFMFIASSTAHPGLLLRTQGLISGLVGLVALLSGAIEPSYPPSDASSFLDASQEVPFFVVHVLAFALWGVCIGVIQILVVIRFGWDLGVMRLIFVSGTLLVLYGIYVFYVLSQWSGAIPWLSGTLLLASGISLAAFTLRVRQREDRELGA